MSKRVLLTGVGGFIGAHCFEYFLNNTDWDIIGIDSFRHKGTCLRVDQLLEESTQRCRLKYRPDKLAEWMYKYKIYRHDLTVPIDPQLENLIFDRQIDKRGKVVEKPIDIIINMASDSAVERSTTDPTACLRNNYELSINMLEFARRCKGLKNFIQISTDEVYGEAPEDGSGHKEWSTILPSNPYAASKAAQEAMAFSYWRTYDLPIIITNTMNVIGEKQDPEKFLPKIIKKVILNEEMPIYADIEEGKEPYIGSRVYLDAKNKADALMFLANLKPARYSEGAKRLDRWHICGNLELNNLMLAQKVATVIGKDLNYKLIPSESARPGYDRRYAMDGSKLAEAGWKPPFTFEETLKRIVDWTIKNQEWMI